MLINACAKLNLFLDILGKRSDNYHEIKTVMCQIDLADEVSLEITDGAGIHLACDNPAVPADEHNTAYKAAALFLKTAGISKCVNISIIKKIPIMAGLGGSSADAAAVLRALNALCDEPFSADELLRLGAKIGADVPFCIHGRTALCTGTGAEIAEILPVPDYVFAIVKPDFSCSTREAYALYSNNPIPAKREIEYFYNAFEELRKNAEIEEIKRKLTQNGASGACMTGSGSAVFGAFEDIRQAEKALADFSYAEKFISACIKTNTMI